MFVPTGQGYNEFSPYFSAMIFFPLFWVVSTVAVPFAIWDDLGTRPVWCPWIAGSVPLFCFLFLISYFLSSNSPIVPSCPSVLVSVHLSIFFTFCSRFLFASRGNWSSPRMPRCASVCKASAGKHGTCQNGIKSDWTLSAHDFHFVRHVFAQAMLAVSWMSGFELAPILRHLQLLSFRLQAPQAT